jgi:hypothetical protein
MKWTYIWDVWIKYPGTRDKNYLRVVADNKREVRSKIAKMYPTTKVLAIELNDQKQIK